MTAMNNHIYRAIDQAKKEGNKGVIGFVGGIEEHNKYSKLKEEGKLEVFEQKYKPYDSADFNCTCMLMRKPIKSL